MIITYKYRIKDSNSRKKLVSLAGKANFVWNYVNEVHHKRLQKYKDGGTHPFLSYYDI